MSKLYLSLSTLAENTYSKTEADTRYVNITGDTMTGSLRFDTTAHGIGWDMNSDFAYIKFYNTGDGDTNSRLEYATGDNGNEFHRWLVDGVETMTSKQSGLTVGTVTKASDSSIKVLSDDSHTASIELYGNSQGTGKVYVGQDHSYGGGIVYTGDSTPSTPFHTDTISFYRKSSGTEYEVFYFSQASNNIIFTGDTTTKGNLHVGSSGDSSIYFYDDNTNTERVLQWDDSENDWRVHDDTGTIQKLWHGGNDGSGSGLDADLLDNVDGALYNKISGDHYYPLGLTGSGTASNWYKIATYQFSGNYNNVAEEWLITGRHDQTITLSIDYEYGGSGAFSREDFIIRTNHGFRDGGQLLAVTDDTNKTLTIYYNRSGTDWDEKYFLSTVSCLGNVTRTISNTNVGTTMPTGDSDILLDHANRTIIWCSDNDGSGSGLDADLLDGHNFDYFATPSDIHNATITLSAGGGMTGGGNFTTNQSSAETITLTHADTSSQASVNNSGGTVIQDITLDTYGHLTGLVSYNLDGRYFTETEADARYVNITGDTMTGDLNNSGVFKGRSFVSNSTSPYQILFPGGASMYQSGSHTGAIKITLPVSWTSTMMSFTVRVFNYSTHTTFDVGIGGYNYSSSSSRWVAPTAYITGSPSSNRDFTVRFGHDGTYCCVYIGETSTTWEYSHVSVIDFHGNNNLAIFSNNWNISTVTSFGTITGTIGNTQIGRTVDGNIVWHAGNDGSGSGLDADLLDGHNSATAATVNTVALRDASGDLTCRYLLSSYCNMSHGTGTRNSDTIFYSSTDNYIRKNTKAGFLNSLGITPTTWIKITSNRNAVNGDGLFCHTGGGSFTVTLPASPSIGDKVIVADPAGTWTAYSLTVARNGQEINNKTENLICDIGFCKVELVYCDVSNGWHVQ